MSSPSLLSPRTTLRGDLTWHVHIKLAVVGLGYIAKSGEKIFHYLFSIALLVGSISYFTMASDLGWTVVGAANNVDNYDQARQIFFVKYINWVVSFPVVSIVLGLVSGVSWATIFYWVALSWTWYVVDSLLATPGTLPRHTRGFLPAGWGSIRLTLGLAHNLCLLP